MPTSYPTPLREPPNPLPSRGEVRDACPFCVNSPFFSRFTENTPCPLVQRLPVYYIVLHGSTPRNLQQSGGCLWRDPPGRVQVATQRRPVPFCRHAADLARQSRSWRRVGQLRASVPRPSRQARPGSGVAGVLAVDQGPRRRWIPCRFGSLRHV